MRKKTIQAVVVLTALAMVAAGCSKPKKLAAAKTSGESTTIPTPITAETTTTAAPTPAAKAAAAKAATKKTSVAGAGARSAADQAQALAVGEKIFPQSTARKKPYYSGVGEDTITLDFSDDPTSCGVNVANAIQAAGGALPTPNRYYRAAPTDQATINAETNESINLMVKYWNEHAFDAADYLPHIRPLMGSDPKNQFFGRHLVANIIDGGSNQCPDKTTAAAKKAAEVDHAFAVFNNLSGLSPAGAYNMAKALNVEGAGTAACASGTAGCIRPMSFGTLGLSDKIYTKFAPYAWTQFATGSTITKGLASYICDRVLPGVVPNRQPNANIDPKKRVFGLVHPNLEQDIALADEFKGYLDANPECKSKGGSKIIAKEVTYDGTDFGAAQRDSANVVAQLHVAQVTTVIMLTDLFIPFFQLAAADGQQYYPEWLWTGGNYEDSSTVQRVNKSFSTKESDGSFGTTEFGVWGGFGFTGGDPFRMYHAYHETAPDGKPCDPATEDGMTHGGNADIEKFCKAPGALVTWYYTMLPMVGGMFFAGPDLTPAHLSAGLQAYPPTRYGGNGPTTDPRGVLVGAGPGKYGFIVDTTEWRWRNDFTSPQPENKAGWGEWPDCQRHYVEWPNLAPNWEANGANYNHFCSNDKPVPGYPHMEPGDSDPTK